MQAHTYTEYLKMFGKNRSKRHFAAENLKSIHNEGPSKIHENKKNNCMDLIFYVKETHPLIFSYKLFQVLCGIYCRFDTNF